MVAEHSSQASAVAGEQYTMRDAARHQPRSIESHELRHPEIQDQGGVGGSLHDNMANVATIEPVPPNGGYGWVVTFAVFIANAHTWGVNSVSYCPV
jgi:hypothetical protein